jgi:hypothetical protein
MTEEDGGTKLRKRPDRLGRRHRAQSASVIGGQSFTKSAAATDSQLDTVMEGSESLTASTSFPPPMALLGRDDEGHDDLVFLADAQRLYQHWCGEEPPRRGRPE